MTFGLLGLLLAAAVIAPPVYLYKTDQDYTKMFPIFKYGRIYLAELAGGVPDPTGPRIATTKASNDVALVKDQEVVEDQEDLEELHSRTYKLAIFQLLDDIEGKAPQLAFFSFCMGCVNVPLHLMLLTGAIFKKSYFLLPWLVVALLEHLVIGVPLIVFFGLISLYLASQLTLFIQAGVLIGSVIFAFLLSLSSWFTVFRCYHMFKSGDWHYDGSGAGNNFGNSDATCGGHPLTQPLLGPTPPPLPPNHPAGSSGSGSGPAGYQLGQYPQYYPPHGNSRALPSAPPGGIYPSLANA